MNGADDGPVEVGDDTPPIKSQAAVHGWACDFFNFGKAEQQGIEYFNPGLVRRPDGLWLLVRRSELFPGMPYGRNGIWACKLDNERKPLGGPNLKFPDSKPDEQFEDPRGVYWNNQTWIGCVNFTWYPNGQWTGAHQMIGVFQDKGGADITQETWTALARRDPIVGTNKGEGGHTGGKHNKNLLWWFVDNKLHCLYTSDPWRIVEFGSKWDEQVYHIAEGVIWKYGVVRGGTPPVLVGDLFYTFFHSSLPWRGRYRRYYMGAITFEARPPFKPVLWTQEPLLIGSQNDPWHQRKPLVVFPCGAVIENNKWLVSLGVNDLKSAWIEIPHDDLKSLLADIPVVPGLSLLSDATAIPVYEPIAYEDLPVPTNISNVSQDETSGTTSAADIQSVDGSEILSQMQPRKTSERIRHSVEERSQPIGIRSELPEMRKQTAGNVEKEIGTLVSDDTRSETASESFAREGGIQRQDNETAAVQSMSESNRIETSPRPSRGLQEKIGSDLALQKLSQSTPQKRKPGRPRKDGLPPGSVPKPRRKYRKRRKTIKS